MAASRDLRFNLFGSDRGASRALDNVGDKADGLGKKLGGLGKLAALGVGGLAVGAFAGLAAAVKGGMEEYSGNQAALAQFTAGLKSTGNVAGITSGQMQELADSIEAKTGTDGAAVVSGGAMLATFTKVRNEVGKGNDVFSRATQAGVDLAARGFGSVESNAVLLGKALNDPVKGLTALGKQGITFTKGQKETIKALVDSGKTLEAQKIILKEVEGQVGGSAEAYGKTLPGQIARSQHALDGIKETVFKAVLPAFSGFLEMVNAKVFPALQRFGAFIGDKIVPAFQVFFGALSGNSEMGEFSGKLQMLNNAGIHVRDFIVGQLIPAFKRYAEFFKTTVIPAVVDLSQKIMGGLRAAFDTIRQKIQENRPQIDQLVAGFRSLVTFIYERVVPVIGTILQGHFKRMGEIIGTGITVVARLVDAFNAIKGPVGSALAFVVQAFLGTVDTMVTAAARAFGWVPGLGPKLKAAAEKVSAFRSEVNAELAKLQNKTITVEVRERYIRSAALRDSAVASRGIGVPGAARTARSVGTNVTVNVGGRTVAKAVTKEQRGRAARGAQVAVP